MPIPPTTSGIGHVDRERHELVARAIDQRVAQADRSHRGCSLRILTAADDPIGHARAHQRTAPELGRILKIVVIHAAMAERQLSTDAGIGDLGRNAIRRTKLAVSCPTDLAQQEATADVGAAAIHRWHAILGLVRPVFTTDRGRYRPVDVDPGYRHHNISMTPPSTRTAAPVVADA